jgi:bifunctional DNA-binding transcriptional regulator/antitoxin component of YhaV-PrlF toxin-antitoxin module
VNDWNLKMPDPTGFSESPATPPAARMDMPVSAHAQMGQDGRVLIPAALRDAAGIERGARLFLRVEGEQIIVESFPATLRRIQRMLAPYKVPGVSIVDELIAERRAEAAREDEECERGPTE